MTRWDRTAPQPSRCELLQVALEGGCWTLFSIEHLLDRLTDPSEHGSDLARPQSTREEPSGSSVAS